MMECPHCKGHLDLTCPSCQAEIVSIDLAHFETAPDESSADVEPEVSESVAPPDQPEPAAVPRRGSVFDNPFYKG